MASFWDIGEEKIQNNGSFEQDGGNIEPIPDGTQVVALIDEAKWDDTMEGAKYISLRWAVMAPGEYKNRKVFQKLWVLGNNPNQADVEKQRNQGVKAKKMLAAIDHNAGGKLFASGEAPTDQSLAMSIANKPMVLKLRVWEMERDGEKKSGNWIAAVSPRNGGGHQQQAPVHQPVQQQAPQQTQQPVDDFDDNSIPF